MKRKILALMLSLTMILTLAACGNEAEEVNGTIEDGSNVVASVADSSEAPTEVPSEAPTEAPTEIPTEAPISEPTEEPTPEVHEHVYGEGVVTTEATCNNVGTITYTCECGEAKYEDIPMLSHEYGEYTYNNDATYEANGTESATCKLCGVVDTRTKEGTMLVKEPEPVVVPSGLDTTIGSDLAFDGTITSHNGVTLNKLASFNTAGLYNRPDEYAANYDWSGYFNNDDPNRANTAQGKAALAWGDNMYNIEESLYGENFDSSQVQGFDIWNNTIYFNYVSGGSAGAIELWRNPSQGCYELRINYDISAGVAKYDANDGRDVLLAMCTMISSTPLELEANLYHDAFEEAIFSQDSYTTIGDCKVKLIYFLPENNSIAYAIKPN